MEHRDYRGLAISCGQERSVERFERALALLQGYYVDPLATIDEAIAEDPEFLMGHAFRAALILTTTERRYLPELARSVTAAEALVARGIGTPRERAHVAATRAFLDGDFAQSAARYHRIAVDTPRDVLAVQLNHLLNFFLGRSAGLRDHVAAALPEYSPADDCYGYVLGMLAFGLEENNEFARAEAAAERALNHQPRDPWAIHALAHCAEMQGRPADGIRLYESRERDWAEGNSFAVHNWWHLALFHLNSSEPSRALAIYDDKIRKNRSEVMLELVDASSFLWRLGLCNVDVGDRWQELADTFRRVDEEGYYAFNDLHAVMAYAGAGRTAEVARVLERLEQSAKTKGTNAFMAREVGLPASRAFRSFAAGDHRAAISELLDLRPIAHRFGGSNAQRDVLEWTLLEAAQRTGDAALARALEAARAARRSGSTGARGTQRSLLLAS
jgi:tetratricopeptide (TPR) repeat protein